MSQSSNDYELLVIDDGSTDHTGAIAGNMAEKNALLLRQDAGIKYKVLGKEDF